MFQPPVLSEKSPLFGCGICYPSPGIVERIGPDWDWFWIDGQHGELGYQDILGLVRACDLVGKPVFVRVASGDYGEIGKALDMGSSGVIIPCVDTAEQARQLVFAAKFPPLGGRSYGSRRLVDLQGRLFVEQANTKTLLIIQIETPLGVSNAEEIAAVEGVDALFLGPDDVMLRRGFSMSTPRSPATLGPDMREVVKACRNHNKKAVTIGIGPEMARFTLECGFDLIVGGGDVGFLASASKKAAGEMQAAALAQVGVAKLSGSLANSRH